MIVASTSLVAFVLAAGTSIGTSTHRVLPSGAPIDPRVPWVRQPIDDLDRTLLERVAGVEAGGLPELEPRWSDVGLQTRDSFTIEMMAELERELGVELPAQAFSFEPTPGVLYVAMDGVTLRPDCDGVESANAAQNCSPLVATETSFPPYGGGAQRQAVFQQLQQYYEPFNLVLTVARPPAYLPYTMAVIGGSAGQAGQPQGVCGVANVACEGLKRNHVSLTFPSSCSGVADTAAQETAHNWGLEHTDDTTDLLYPFTTGGFKRFVDNCMDINHATSQTMTTQCRHIHQVHCPAGQGEQQNSFRELMSVFGPREVDDQAPVITDIWPEDGAVFTDSESWAGGARLDDNSNFIGVRWTWIDGLPEELESYSRCTNKVCDRDYNPGPSFDPAAMAWDFVNMDEPPVGTYRFELEAVDAYANFVSRTITVTVVADEGGASTTSGGVAATSAAESMGTGAAGTGGNDANSTHGDGGTGGEPGAADGSSASRADSGGCRVNPDPRLSLAFLLVLAVWGCPRRRCQPRSQAQP